MSFDIAVTLAVAGAAVVLFVIERFSLATVAMLALSALLVTGVIDPGQAFAGFSSPATVTVAAMFVLSAGIASTGMVDAVGDAIAALLDRRFELGFVALLAATAVLSAFINNTAVVAVFLPVVLHCSRRTGVSANRLLIPLSFASMFGGASTTIGTSTNLLVSSMMEDHGLEPLGLVELAPLGLVLTALGCGYLLIAQRWLPTRRPSDNLTEDFEVVTYVTDVELSAASPSVGLTLGEAPLIRDLDADVLAVFRDGLESAMPHDNLVLRAGDTLRLRCPLEQIRAIRAREAVSLATPSIEAREGGGGETALIEVVVTAKAPFEGKPLVEARVPESFNAIVLAIRHRGKLTRDRLGDVSVHAGDALLLEVDRDNLGKLRRSPWFVVVSERRLPDRRPLWLAGAILVGVVATAAAGVVPIVTAATVGAVAMIATGAVTHEEALEAIDWNVLILLGGILSVGAAMESSGAAALIGDGLVDGVGRFGGHAVVSATFLGAALLSAFLSNNGTAVLLVPIAVAAAHALGVDARPLVVAVAFGASTSFATPVGYQTNALVFSAGQYQFADFVRVGAPLTLVFWVAATVGIPLLWPLG